MSQCIALSGTPTRTPRISRWGLYLSSLAASMLFVLSAGGQTTYYSKASATNFADVTSWGTNSDGSGSSPASISSADDYIISNSSALTLNGNAAVRNLTMSSGSLTVASNTLTVSAATGNASTMSIAGGTLMVSGGTIDVHGNVVIGSLATFNQSGGLIRVDGNSGTAATSVAAGTAMFSLQTFVTYLTGGTILIVDPNANSTGNSFEYNNVNPFNPLQSSTHLIQLGDGISTDATANTSGFTINTFVGSSRFQFANLALDAGTTGNRANLVSVSSFGIARDLTITSGVFRPGVAMNVGGNITNNGTLQTTSAVNLAMFNTGVTSASLIPQTISGTGTFRNATSNGSSTANFSTLLINNLSSGGVTFANANALLSANGVTNTGTATTLTLSAGTINLAGGTFVLGISTASTGTLNFTSGGFSGGSMKRWVSTTSLPATLSSTVPVFPFVSSGNARHVYMARSGAWTAGGSITATYADAAGYTPVSVVDAGYTIERRSNASWSFATGNSADPGSTTTSVGLAGEGIFAMASNPGTAPRVMQAASATGTHAPGTGSQSSPIANRTTITSANLTGATHYIGIGNADVGFYTIASGNWEDGSTWSTGTAPTINDIVTISDGHTVTISATPASAKSVLMNGTSTINVNGSTLTIASPVSASVVMSTSLQSKVNINGGAVTVGSGLVRFAGFQNNGTLTISSGSLTVNGYLINASTSTFSQTGGAVVIDQNQAASTTNSYTAGAGLQFATSNITLSGGTLTIVDPNAATTNTPVMTYTGPGLVYATTGHTLRIGDGVSTDAGNANYGFRLSVQGMVFGNLEINTLQTPATNATAPGTRVVSTSQSQFIVNGDVTITSGELWNLGTTNTFYFGKDIINNAALSVEGILRTAYTANAIITLTSNAQSIGGTGFFRNSTTARTADLFTLGINNGHASGVTLNVPLTVSSTLLLINGTVNTTSANLLTLGTTTSAGTLTINGAPTVATYVKGPFARMIPASQTGTTTYVFPVGKSAYKPYDLVNPVTTSGGPVKIVAEVFDGSTGGTPSNAFSAISTSRYWQVSIASGAANFTSARMRLNDATGSFNAIGSSTTLAGTYTLVGGGLPTVTSTSITSATPATTSLDGFYLMATTAPPTISNLVATMQAGDRCTGSIPRDITVDVTPAGSAITSVVISYTVNNGATQTVTMTNTGGNSWAGTIPSVSPSSGSVIWSILATDANGLVATQAGMGYRDNPLANVAMSVSASPAAICAGGSSTLTASSTNTGAAATYTTPPAVTNPTTDEDLGNVRISQGATTILNNTTARNSLVGTIGTATGTAGSYSNFTAFGPYALTAGQTYSFSLSSLQETTAFGNAMAIYIDYNRDGDFADAGEQIYTSAATSGGAHTETGSFTVPATAYNGNTRMRVISNEGLISSSTQAVSWGEYEEYMLNITSSNPGGPLQLGSYAFAGTSFFESSNTNSITVMPASTNTYFVQGYELADMGGCSTSLSASGATVTVNPLPSAPTASNSSQCGTAVPTASVASTSGLPTPTFKWYDAASGGTLLQSSTSTTYTTAINTTTTFYVAELNATTGCESSTRTAVTVTVIVPDAVSATNSTTGAICPGTAVTLTATQTGSTNTYTYTWTASPSSGSGITGASPVTGASASVTPTAGGTFVYTVTAVDGSCTTTSTTTVTVTAPPTITTATGPSAVCPSSPVALAATSVSVQSGTVALGTGTGTNATSTSAGAAYPSWYGNARQQYLVPASELAALGLSAGNITSLSFDVAAANGNPSTLNGYTIKIGTTNASAITTFQTLGSAVTVWGPQNYTPVVGVNTHTFTTPFNWNGTSNLIVEICFSNSVSGSASAQTKLTPTAYSSNVYFQLDGATTTACTTTTVSGTGSARPNMVFAGQVATNITSSPNFTWTWNPGSLSGASVTGTSMANTTGAPVNQVFTVTLTDNNTNCFSTAQVTVSVNPTPTAPTASNSTQCGTAVPTASVASTTGAGTPSFKWYDAASGGNMLQSSTSTTYTSAISSTTTFYVAEVSAAGCESDRTAVTVTVTAPDAVTASGNSPVCAGGTVNLLATQTGSNQNYTYTWTASPSSGSGITGASPVTGASASVTPTAAGSYAYTVTAVDGSCTTTSTVNVTVNANPAITTATGPASVCSNAPVALAATSIAVQSGTVALGTGTATNGASTAASAAYPTWYGNGRQQYLVPASELTALGLNAGNITSLSFDVVTANGDPATLNGYTIRIGSTNASAITTFQTLGSAVTVWGPQNYTPVVGVNTHTFSTPFNWNGTSNLIVEICFSNGVTGNGSAQTKQTATAYSSNVWYQVDGATTTACTNTTVSGTASARPNMVFAGQVATDITSSPNFTWTWNPGGLTGASVTATSPSNNTASPVSQAYTVTATNTTTGCFSTATVNVSVKSVIAAPTGTNSAQCGLAVPTASVASTTGTATPTFRWYDAATAGNMLQSSTSTTYTTAISSTTTFYVSEYDAASGCESARTAVTVTVTQPDAVTASSNGPVCLGSTVNLSAAQTGSTNTYTYTWTASPSTGSGITGASPVTGASASVTPTAAGTYVYTVTAVDGQCTTSSTVSVTVNSNPSIVSTTATPTSVCAGSSVLLSATAGTIQPGVATIGTDNAPTKLTTTGVPYRTGSSGFVRNQFLVLASELTAMGLQPGNITSIGFVVTSASGNMTNMSFKLAHTTSTALSATFLTPTFTTVATAATYSPVVGDNIHTVTTPFVWDGTSNIVVDVCGQVGTGVGCTMATYTTSGITTVGYGGGTSCTTATGTTVANSRPVMLFGGNVLANTTGNYSWLWTPGNLSGATVNATTPNTSGVVTYTVKATDLPTGCFSTATVNVTVGATLVPNGTASPATICAGGSSTLSAAPTGGGAPFTYSWKDASNNVISTSASVSVSPASTTAYTLSVTDNCGSTQTQTVTVTVTAPPTVSINEASPVSVCATTASLTSTTNAASPTYSWIFNGSPVGVTTANYNVNASGSYTLKVTDAATGCFSTSAAVTVNLLAYPSSVAVTPLSAATICLGQSQTITATATLQNNSTPNVTIFSENFNAGTLGNFSIVNATMTNNLGQWTVRSSPYTYGTSLTNVTIDGTSFVLANSDAAGSGTTTQTRLVSNSFSTVGYTVVTVGFKHFARSGGTIITEYSTNGTTWSTIPSGDFTGGTTGGGTNPPTITTSTLTLPAAALNQANVRIRFRYDAGWDWYWGVDDIRVMGASQGYYAWSSDATAGVPNAATTAAASNNSVSVTPTAAGTYVYTVTASVPGNSCTNTATVTLNVLTPSTAPAMLNSSAATATCAGANVVLTQTGGSLGDGAHWQWYRDAAYTLAVGGPLTSSNAQITVAPAATTTYYLRAEGGTAPCAANISGSASVVVTVRTPLSASIAAAQPVQCETGLTATLNITGGPANGTVTVTTNGANPQTITLDGSGAATFTSDPLMANATFTITSVSDGTCTTTTNTSATVYVGVLIADPISNQSVCAGSTVGPIAFSGNFPAGTQYSWTSSNPAVGLAQSSGTGTQLPAFTATNSGTTDIYTDIAVTPIVTSAAECKVRQMVFRITVRPVPMMNAVGSQTVCAGTMTTPVTFSSSVAGASYIWSNSNPAIGIAASGGGNLPAFVAQNNTGAATISGTITVTPVAIGCSGVPTTFTITVNRSAAAIAYTGSPYCQVGTVNPVLTGTRGGTFSSTAGLVISATTGQINLGQSLPGTYTITYTAPATAGGCGGAVTTQISIKPQAVVNTIGNQEYCQGLLTAPVPFSGTATNYAWSNSNPSIGLAASGTGTQLPSFTTVNGGPLANDAYIAVTPLGNGTSTCDGRAIKFRFRVKFCPPVTQAGGTGGGSATARMASQVVVGPNPSTGRVTLNYTGTEAGPFTVQLLTQYGQAMNRPVTFTGTTYTLDLTGMTPGVYVIQLVNTRTNTTIQKQIVKL